MKTHCRCGTCGARRKLDSHPDEYRVQPRCVRCGNRNWRRDEYRHRVELPMIRGESWTI